jgi:cytochrome c-type biogenesis protein CcmE
MLQKENMSVSLPNIYKHIKEFTMKLSLRFSIILVFISLFVISCKEDTQPTKSEKSVIDYQSIIQDIDGSPIINAEVKFIEKGEVIATDTTDESGKFSFNDIEADLSELSLSIVHTFYNSLTIPYSDISDGNENITLELKEDCCISTNITVKNKDGNPLKGVKIQLRKDMETLKKGISDKDGIVEFSGICEDEYEFRIVADGYEVLEKIENLESCDETYEFSYTLNSKEEEDCCESAFIFKPQNKDGEILNGTKVFIYKDGKVIQDPVVKDGKAVIDGLCEGKYVIVYKNENYEEKEVAVELGCDEEKTLEHVLTKKNDEECCDAILKFLVKDNKSKEYLKGASITLKLDGKTIFEERKTNTDGYVIEDNLCKGEYTVIIKMDGYKTIETTWNIEKCDDFQEHFSLVKEEEDCCESAFIFKPKNKDGEILNGTKVFIYKDGKVIQDPVVKDGKAVLDELCEGKYVIVYKNENYQEKEVSVELGCDEEKTLEHVLSKKDDDCCDAILKFFVKDNKSKEYLKDASVTLKLDGKTIFDNRKTNADGYVIEDNLCKGKYNVIIEMDGYKTIETTWNIEKCDDFQEHFWLEKE